MIGHYGTSNKNNIFHQKAFCAALRLISHPFNFYGEYRRDDIEESIVSETFINFRLPFNLVGRTPESDLCQDVQQDWADLRGRRKPPSQIQVAPASANRGGPHSRVRQGPHDRECHLRPPGGVRLRGC